jgi:hypothetical protein
MFSSSFDTVQDMEDLQRRIYLFISMASCSLCCHKYYELILIILTIIMSCRIQSLFWLAYCLSFWGLMPPPPLILLSSRTTSPSSNTAFNHFCQHPFPVAYYCKIDATTYFLCHICCSAQADSTSSSCSRFLARNVHWFPAGDPLLGSSSTTMVLLLGGMIVVLARPPVFLSCFGMHRSAACYLWNCSRNIILRNLWMPLLPTLTYCSTCVALGNTIGMCLLYVYSKETLRTVVTTAKHHTRSIVETKDNCTHPIVRNPPIW